MNASSTWTVIADEAISIDVFTTFGWDAGTTAVDVIGTDWCVKRNGTVKIERTLREGRGERLIEAISNVTVSSLFGDVVGRGRTVKEAAEDYGSKVAQAIVAMRRQAARA